MRPFLRTLCGRESGSETGGYGRRRIARGAFAWLLISVGLLTIAAAKEPASTVRLVSDPWPPFTGEEGSPRVAVDLVQMALLRSGYASSSTIAVGESTDIVEQIRKGDFDGSAALWKTPEREASLLFSLPYLENRLVLVGREGSPVDAKSVSELRGKRVATVQAYAYGGVLDAKIGPELVPGESDLGNIRKLLDGEVDYVLVDELLIHHIFQARGADAEASLDVGRFPLVSRKLHFAVRKDFDGAAELIDAFDREIRSMIMDGAYHRALAVDWIWADIDGDGVAELVLGGTQAGLEPPEDAYGVLYPDTGGLEDKDESGLVVEGVVYDTWDNVPDRYKVKIDRTRPPVDATIPVFRF